MPEEEPYWKQRKKAVQEAVELRGVGGKVTPPEGMTPEQREKWEGTIKSEEEKREPSEYEEKMASIQEARLGGPAMDPAKVEQFGREITPEGAQTAAEIALSFTPVGPAIDAKDLFVAVKERDPLMATLSAVGLVGPFMGLDKALRESLKSATKTLKPAAATSAYGRKVGSQTPKFDLEQWEPPDLPGNYLVHYSVASAKLKDQLGKASKGLQELQQGLGSRWSSISKIERELMAEAASATPLVKPEHVKIFRELADASGRKIDEITTSSDYKEAQEVLYRAVSWKPSIPGMEVGQRTAVARYRQAVEALEAVEETGQHLLEQADVIVMIKNTLKARAATSSAIREFTQLKRAAEDVWDSLRLDSMTPPQKMRTASLDQQDVLTRATHAGTHARYWHSRAEKLQAQLVKRFENSYWMKQLWGAD